jgi:hypothetical protein
MSHILCASNQLPKAIICHILQWLNLREKISNSGVNKLWQSAVLEPHLWRGIEIIVKPEDDDPNMLALSETSSAPWLGLVEKISITTENMRLRVNRDVGFKWGDRETYGSERRIAYWNAKFTAGETPYKTSHEMIRDLYSKDLIKSNGIYPVAPLWRALEEHITAGTMKYLRCLDISNVMVTPAFIAALTKMPRLEKLSIDTSSMRGDIVASLMCSRSLSSTPLFDEFEDAIAGHASLCSLKIHGTVPDTLSIVLMAILEEDHLEELEVIAQPSYLPTLSHLKRELERVLAGTTKLQVLKSTHWYTDTVQSWNNANNSKKVVVEV